jgi:hypothetical protein
MQSRFPNRKSFAAIALVAAAAAAGCGGGSSSKTTASAPPASTPAAAVTTSAPASTTTPSSSSSDLSGTWSGHYSGAFNGTFTLKWTQSGSKLDGTINLSSAGGPTDIHGSVSGSSIRFGTVGTEAITYTGSVSGNSMSGSYKTPSGGGSWSASKS